MCLVIMNPLECPFLIARMFSLTFLSSLLKIEVLQSFLYLLVALGTSEIAISNPLKNLDACKTAIIRQDTTQTTFSSQQINRDIKLLSTKVRQPHDIIMFSIEDLSVDPEFLEQVRKAFADPNALEWDFYLQRQTQIEYLKRHLPDSILSQITNTMWSDFYYGRNTKEMEGNLLPHLNRISLMEYQLIQPTRLRAISRFNLHFEGNRWKVQQVKAHSFEQSSALSTEYQQDFRIEGERRFKELRLGDISETLIKVLQGLASLIHTYNSEILDLEASIHFMKIIKRPYSSQVVTNSPEGIHQDGKDFVVPALVIERENIQGGQNLIYDARGVPLREDGNPNFKERTPNKGITLLPGDGLLHQDQGSPLWHKVTPIELQDHSVEGYRSIIGIDFQIK